MSEEDEREMKREGRRRIKVMWSMSLAWVHACKNLVCVLQREFLEAEFLLQSNNLLTLHRLRGSSLYKGAS